MTGGAACYRVYATADGRHLAVGALELKFWEAFCDAAGLGELRRRHWAHGEAPGSAAAQQTTIARVAERIRSRHLAEWTDEFADVDACVTPVLTPAEALAPRRLRRAASCSASGAVTEVGPLAQMSGHALRPAPAPRAGQHTRALLGRARTVFAGDRRTARGQVVKEAA